MCVSECFGVSRPLGPPANMPYAEVSKSNSRPGKRVLSREFDQCNRVQMGEKSENLLFQANWILLLFIILKILNLLPPDKYLFLIELSSCLKRKCLFGDHCDCLVRMLPHEKACALSKRPGLPTKTTASGGQCQCDRNLLLTLAS